MTTLLDIVGKFSCILKSLSDLAHIGLSAKFEVKIPNEFDWSAVFCKMQNESWSALHPCPIVHSFIWRRLGRTTFHYYPVLNRNGSSDNRSCVGASIHENFAHISLLDFRFLALQNAFDFVSIFGSVFLSLRAAKILIWCPLFQVGVMVVVAIAPIPSQCASDLPGGQHWA